jgi:hypothetical protein
VRLSKSVSRAAAQVVLTGFGSHGRGTDTMRESQTTRTLTRSGLTAARAAPGLAEELAEEAAKDG